MTDRRLTDDELDEIEQWCSTYYTVDPHIVALVAEVREHRAARTLTDDERRTVHLLRDSTDPHDRRALAIIDRITEGPRRD